MKKIVLFASLFSLLHFALAQSPHAADTLAPQPYQARPDSNAPVTADSVVTRGVGIFADISKSAGLTTWRHSAGTRQKQFILHITVHSTREFDETIAGEAL